MNIFRCFFLNAAPRYSRIPSLMSKDALFTPYLEDWFTKHQRHFPWRDTHDPYLVWVSEIMSHQTQIERVADKFYPRFIKAFPTLSSLAASDWSVVFPIWEGLGYYQRGKNMLRTAQAVATKHDGKFPQDLESLENLPGIGKYTAAAISSFAFDTKVPAIDTNISKIVKTLWPNKDMILMAQKLIDQSSSGCLWNSAMMDLASQLRAGKNIEGKLGKTFFPEEVAKQFIPQRKAPKNKKTPKKRSAYRIEVGIACIYENGKYLVQTRPEGKSFAGSLEFPGGKREKGENFRECVKREILEEIGVKVSVRPHFYEEICTFKDNKVELLLRFHRCQIQAGTPAPLENQMIKWVAPADFFDENFLTTNHNALRVLQKMKV